MLFEPGRHEPLRDTEWDTARANEAIRAVAADLEETLGSGIVWPVHPLDGEEEPQTGNKSLYLGASGALWAMWYLEQEGAVGFRINPSDLIGRVYQSYLTEPDTGEVVPSYYLGEAGILLVLWRLTQSHDAADSLSVSIERNIPNPTNEALWAAPGTMVGAWHMLQWTGERRWHDLFLENAERLWETWRPSENAPCHLWTQDLYGSIVQLMGAGHGFAGNVYPLLRGAALLAAERREVLYDRCVETLRTTAMFEDDSANWPPERRHSAAWSNESARAVVPWGAGHCDRAVGFSAAKVGRDGRDTGQGRHHRVAGWPAGKRLWHVSRNGGQRLRSAEATSTYR